MRNWIPLLLLSALTSAGIGKSHAQELTPEEKRGQHIYRTGTTPAGDQIPVFLGESKTPIPSHLFACSNCHGPDGKGVPEGGVEPSDITWHSLTKPYGAIAGTHRNRPPYNAKQVLNAVRKGMDPLGSKLEATMPRYQLSEENGKAIIAYLKVIHRVDDPGISGDRLRVGVVVPSGKPFQTIQTSLKAYFEPVNKEGGVYRRSIELATLQLSADPSQWAAEWTEFTQKETPFVLLAPVMEGADEEALIEVIDRHQIPVISPFTVDPPELDIPSPNIFYFHPGLKMRRQILLQYASEQLTAGSPPGVLQTGDQEKVHQLKRDNVKAILISGAELPAVLKLLERVKWSPALLIDHTSVVPLLDRYPGDVFVSSPNQGPLFQKQATHYQNSSLVAADVFRSVLLKAGRKVTRKKVIELFEQLHHQETGWTGPLTFSVNHRIGAEGAFISKYGSAPPDSDKASPRQWIPLKKEP